MPYGLLADVVVLLHLAFILFAGLGAWLAFRWPRVLWVQLPCFAWGVLIEVTGRICPLTPLENRLRRAAGEAAYQGDFVTRYVVPIVYPPELTRDVQLALAVLLVATNVTAWACLRRRWGRRSPSRGV